MGGHLRPGHAAALGNVTWIVDFNRQSLDRVVPGIRSARARVACSRDHGWHVRDAEVRPAACARRSRCDGGDTLRRRIDEMPNGEYQSLLRRPGERDPRRARGRRPPAAPGQARARARATTPTRSWPRLIGDLARARPGRRHRRRSRRCDAETERPSVIFAFTIKGWGLPIAGHPLNHSAVLSPAADRRAAAQALADADDEWAAFDRGLGRRRALCRRSRERLTEDDGAPARDARPGRRAGRARRHAARARPRRRRRSRARCRTWRKLEAVGARTS